MLNKLTILDHADQFIREIKFHRGLNVIVASKSNSSAKGEDPKKKTRNGVGKTTLLHLVRFCLGEKLEFRKSDAVQGYAIILEATMGGYHFEVERLIPAKRRRSSKPEMVKVIFYELPAGERVPDVGNYATTFRSGYQCFEMSVENWAAFVARIAFLRTGGRIEGDHLLGFFLRSEYIRAVHPQSKTKGIVARRALSFLLNLHWKHYAAFTDIASRTVRPKRACDYFKDYLDEERIDKSVFLSRLEDKRLLLRDTKANIETLKVDSARLLSEKQYVDNATAIKNVNERITELTMRERALARELERGKLPDNLVSLAYEEAKRVLRDDKLKSLDEVMSFNTNVLGSFSQMIENELKATREELKDARARHRELLKEADEAKKVLEAQGVLEQYAALNERAKDLEADIKMAEVRLNAATAAETTLESLRQEKEAEVASFTADYNGELIMRTDIEMVYRQFARFLYGNVDADFQIALTKPGVKNPSYIFDPYIQKAGSEGVDKMIMFAFDILLMRKSRSLKDNIDFIFHDSIIFDHTDSRQVANAFDLLLKETAEYDYQYICTINSDTLGRVADQEKLTDLEPYFCDVDLDDSESGSLFRKWF